LDDLLSRRDKEQAAGLFADFLIDNVALFRQVESPFRAGNGGGPLDLLAELERKAQRRARRLPTEGFLDARSLI